MWQWCETPSLVQRDVRGDGSLIGCGSYGFCIPLRDQATFESFCLKIPKVNGRPEAQSLKEEFDLLAKLNHPNVMRVLAWVSSSDGHWSGFLMPLGKTNLWGWVTATDAVTPAWKVSVLVQVARGLAYLHHCSIVHLDMKPENNIIHDCGAGPPSVRVSDLGVAMIRRRSAMVRCDCVNSAPYRPVGLFHTEASEVPVGFCFDLWAFGCVIFDVLQSHPRLRNAKGRCLRLFSGVVMCRMERQVLSTRNSRLVLHLKKEATLLVVSLQPPSRKEACGSRRMIASLVRGVMGLSA